MSKFDLLPNRWRTSEHATRHAEAIAAILDTPPIAPRTDGMVLFATIGTADLLQFLVAVKSLHHQLDRGRVVLLDDGTLTGEDRALLAHHCGDPEILGLGDADMAGFPRGRDWEGLLTILDRRKGEYWIRLDSHTVTLGPVPDIAQALASNASFTLAGAAEAASQPRLLGDFARRHYPDGPQSGSIAVQMESRLGLLSKPDRRYARSGTGIAGFAAGGPGRRFARAFLVQMSAMLGEEALSLPGAEQVTASFQIASEPRSVMLPSDHYCNHAPQSRQPGARFIHFAGPDHYEDGAYTSTSRRVIDRLLAR